MHDIPLRYVETLTSRSRWNSLDLLLAFLGVCFYSYKLLRSPGRAQVYARHLSVSKPKAGTEDLGERTVKG